jgi:transposase
MPNDARIRELQQAHARLRTDNKKLQADNATLQATIEQQQQTIDEQQSLLEELQRERDLLKRSLFGHRRERFEDPDQGLLFDYVVVGEEATTEDDEADKDTDSPAVEPKKKRRGRQRRVIPETLERQRRERKLQDDEIPAELRGRKLRRFMKLVGEWIEMQPPKLIVIEEYVETVAIDNEDETATEMITAPREPRILNSLAGPSLLAAIAVQHFADHQPYYRLEEILQRAGLSIGRPTQSRWMIELAIALLPLVDLMRRRALQSALAQADETPVKMLQPGAGKAKTTYLWAVLGSGHFPYTTFYFTEDRSRAGPKQWFADFRGWLVSDAYIVYELLGLDSLGRILLAGCFAHARRKFEALHVLGATVATSRALGYFQRLFDLEHQFRDLSDDDRRRQRDIHSRPLLEEMKAWFDAQLSELRPRHPLRSAIQYMTNRWDWFTRFLESGSIPLDNNASEQAVKNPVMGKKNWLFFGSPRGGEGSAVLFTLTATCRRLQIDPHAYLTDVCQRLPLIDVTDESQLSSFLPDVWLASHPESRLTMRAEESASKLSRQRDRRQARRKSLEAA